MKIRMMLLLSVCLAAHVHGAASEEAKTLDDCYAVAQGKNTQDHIYQVYDFDCRYAHGPQIESGGVGALFVYGSFDADKTRAYFSEHFLRQVATADMPSDDYNTNGEVLLNVAKDVLDLFRILQFRLN